MVSADNKPATDPILLQTALSRFDSSSLASYMKAPFGHYTPVMIRAAQPDMNLICSQSYDCATTFTRRTYSLPCPTCIRYPCTLPLTRNSPRMTARNHVLSMFHSQSNALCPLTVSFFTLHPFLPLCPSRLFFTLSACISYIPLPIELYLLDHFFGPAWTEVCLAGPGARLYYIQPSLALFIGVH